MLVIGLTGGSGTGKGVVSLSFLKHNIASIDTDAIYRELTSKKDSPCLSALRAEFGESIISESGALDRRALAEIVFAEGAEYKRERLNKLTHGFIIQELKDRIPVLEKQGCFGVLIDAPLLFESGFDKECDIILCVISEKDTRIKRIIKRDGITEEMAERRICSQLDDEYLIAHSDFTVYNNGDIEELETEVAKITEIIKNKFSGDKNNERKE